VHTPSKGKSDESHSFYEELEHAILSFFKVPYENSIAGINTKVLRENIFKPTICNESLRKDGNDNGVRIVNFNPPKNLLVKDMMFPHRNIHRYNWTSPDGKTHNKIDHILIDRRWHSSILDVRSFSWK